MKRILIALLALLWLIPLAQAVPAYPGTYKYKQPDGSVIVLQNHGDEYYHWTTDAAGRTVEKGSDGFYRPVTISTAEHQARAARARALNPRQMGYWSSYDDHPVTNFGDRKILCILAEFQPEKDSEGNELFSGKYVMTDPYQHFWDMLNKPNYDYNGAIGSVRDYYVQNSIGQYRPQFDVFLCPEPLSQPSSYYDNGKEYEAIKEAVTKIAARMTGENQFDIDDYDTDGDGTVDMVLFYYPGYNEAEGGDTWTIWPHQQSGNYGDLTDQNGHSKHFRRYFCTSELRGNTGNEAAAIGTTCHEFAHSLGLPDFYDVGEAEHGGEIPSRDLTYVYDLMCYGNYNDAGRRPPYLTSLERNMLGWMPAPEAILSGGDYILEGVQDNKAYRIETEVAGEYFLLECRDGSGWDSGVAYSGLVIYHVDQSDRSISGSTTASYLWSNTNNINSYASHPCYYIVPSGPSSSSGSHLVFPGAANKTSYGPEDWNGDPVSISLSGISFQGEKVSFHVVSDAAIILDGLVKDVFGQPVSGATVSLIRSAHEFAAPPLIPNDKTCTTDENGYYSFSLASTASRNQVVTVTKDGYVSQAANVLLTGRANQQDFVMILQGQESPETLKKSYGNTLYNASIGGGDVAVGILYTAAELAELGAIGAAISDVRFLLGANQGESVYVIVDIGGVRSLFGVAAGYEANVPVTVDLSNQNLVIPAGADVYIGVGLQNIPTLEGYYPFRYFEIDAPNGGNYMMSSFLNSGSSWQEVTFNRPAAFAISANLTRTVSEDFASYGVSYIQLVDGVPQAVPAAGKTVYAISWTLDGTAVDVPPAVESLSAGAHTYKARLEFYDGTAERVYFDVTKE